MKYFILYTFKQWRKMMKHIVALLIKYTAITAVLL
ncbi:hypothetical protein CN687_31165, partial [Bacillus toyonensis]